MITLASGEHNLTVDAGFYKKASVGDFVWQDSNHNWLQDAGEAGIGGITVNLLNSSGAVVASTKTDSTGHYKFVDLDPGTYQLQFDKTNVMYIGYIATRRPEQALRMVLDRARTRRALLAERSSS